MPETHFQIARVNLCWEISSVYTVPATFLHYFHLSLHDVISTCLWGSIYCVRVCLASDGFIGLHALHVSWVNLNYYSCSIVIEVLAQSGLPKVFFMLVWLITILSNLQIFEPAFFIGHSCFFIEPNKGCAAIVLSVLQLRYTCMLLINSSVCVVQTIYIYWSLHGTSNWMYLSPLLGEFTFVRSVRWKEFSGIFAYVYSSTLNKDWPHTHTHTHTHTHNIYTATKNSAQMAGVYSSCTSSQKDVHAESQTLSVLHWQ